MVCFTNESPYQIYLGLLRPTNASHRAFHTLWHSLLTSLLGWLQLFHPLWLNIHSRCGGSARPSHGLGPASTCAVCSVPLTRKLLLASGDPVFIWCAHDAFFWPTKIRFWPTNEFSTLFFSMKMAIGKNRLSKLHYRFRRCSTLIKTV